MRLYAGFAQSNYEQGLLVLTDYSNGPDAEVERYLSPNRVGGLRIVDVKGQIVTLSAQNDEQFYFDIVLRKWLDAGEVNCVPRFKLNTGRTDFVPLGEGFYKNGAWYIDSGGVRLRVMPRQKDKTDVLEVAEYYMAGTNYLPESGSGSVPARVYTYSLPGGADGAYIVDALCQRLTIGTRDGKSYFVFDIPTRQWLTPPTK